MNGLERAAICPATALFNSALGPLHWARSDVPPRLNIFYQPPLCVYVKSPLTPVKRNSQALYVLQYNNRRYHVMSLWQCHLASCWPTLHPMYTTFIISSGI